MKYAITLFSVLMAIGLVGCASQKKEKPVPQPVYLEEVPYGSTQNVRTGEIVKAYPIARYIDPANGTTMHERHVIYRLERPNRWRLNPPQGQYDANLLGPVAGVRKPYYQPAPTSAELSRELQRQKAASAAIDARAAQMAQNAQQELSRAQAERGRTEALLNEQKASQQAIERQLANIATKVGETEGQVREIQSNASKTQSPDSSETSTSKSSSPGPVETQDSSQTPEATPQKPLEPTL